MGPVVQTCRQREHCFDFSDFDAAAESGPDPESTLKLKSTDPADHPFIDPRYYSHPRDAEIMMEGHKHSNLIILSLGIRDDVIKPLNNKRPLLQVWNLPGM